MAQEGIKISLYVIRNKLVTNMKTGQTEVGKTFPEGSQSSALSFSKISR